MLKELWTVSRNPGSFIKVEENLKGRGPRFPTGDESREIGLWSEIVDGRIVKEG